MDVNSTISYSIGQLSTLARVKIPTIRYYEKVGLLAQPVRSTGNQRRYDQSGLDRLTFVRHARDLGLSLEMVKRLLAISGQHTLTCERVHRIASEHLETVRERIAWLQTLEAELTRVEAQCEHGRLDACLVLAILNDHTHCNTDH